MSNSTVLVATPIHSICYPNSLWSDTFKLYSRGTTLDLHCDKPFHRYFEVFLPPSSVGWRSRTCISISISVSDLELTQWALNWGSCWWTSHSWILSLKTKFPLLWSTSAIMYLCIVLDEVLLLEMMLFKFGLEKVVLFSLILCCGVILRDYICLLTTWSVALCFQLLWPPHWWQLSML